ncbi:MAG TPA: DUF4160 domain-containing protein [Acidobacteriaceae bacterium]
MGSKTFDGVWFISFSDDHPPPHVHGRYAGIEVLVELVNGTVRLALRSKPVRPRNAKQSDVQHILRTATMNASELLELWRNTHG